MTVDFERLWLEKLRGGLEVHLGEEAAAEIMAGSESLTDQTDLAARVEWTRSMIARLEKRAGSEHARQILLGCACLPSRESLNEARDAYAATGSIEDARRILERDFRGFLSDTIGLSTSQVEHILSRGMGIAGTLREGRIIATKIPKSGKLLEYLEEDDPKRRRALYCHCPRVRHLVGTGEELSRLYCYCGGGFYRFIWQYVLDSPVEIELLDSVMGEGDVCSFAITPICSSPADARE